MQRKTQGIILQSTKFQDKKNILKVFTLQHGMQSYIVNVGHSAKSKIKPAHILSLNQIEFTEHIKNTRSLQLISDIHVLHIYQTLYANPIKNTIAIFLNEVILKALREQPENPELFFFITQKLAILDDLHVEGTNFHLHFLLEMSSYLGFYPNNNYSDKNCLFDLQDGVFSDKIPPHVYYADSELSFYFSSLMNKKDDFSCTSKTRNDLLNMLLLLYRLHIPGFGEVKSLQILKEILA